MQDHTKPDGWNVVEAPSPSHSATVDASVSNRDKIGSRLARRLDHLDPRKQDGRSFSTRAEPVERIEALQHHQIRWRALLTAADPTNRGLDPQSVLPRLGEISHKAQLLFFLIWRERKTGTARQYSELIALVPLAPATIARIKAPWLTGWANSWWSVASPIVHRRHYSAVAGAIINWLSNKLVPTGALVLRDLVSDAPFAQALLANPRVTVFRRGRAQPTLSLNLLVAPTELAGRNDIVVKGDPKFTTTDLDACLSLSARWGGPGSAPMASSARTF